jgi:SAM-dependent methyltransferase
MQLPIPVSTKEVRRDYDDQYLDKGIRDSDSFYRWVLDLLAVRPPARLLDVSCGEGHQLRWALHRQVSAFGLDIASVAADLSRRAVPGAAVVVGNGERLPFADRTFDYVTNLGSLEHYWVPEAGVREMARVLVPEGRACLLLPNTFFAIDLIWKVWRTGYGPSHTQVIERFAAKNEWRDFIEANGLVVDRIVKYNSIFPRSREDVRWFLSHPKRLLSLLTSPLTPTNFAFSFAFLCRPAT